MKSLLPLPAVVLLALVPETAGAATLPPTSVSSTVLAYDCTAISCSPNPFHGTGSASQASPNAFGSTTLDLSKAPSISSRADASVASGGVGSPQAPSSSSSGEMVLRYYFQLKGPSNAVSVPVHFVSSGSVQMTGSSLYGGGSPSGGSALAEARLWLEGAAPNQGAVPIVNEDIFVEQYNIGSTGSASRSFNVDHVINMSTDIVYDVMMQVKSAAAVNPNSGPVPSALQALATIDPYLYIDPAYQGMFKDYSIAFSGGIVNSLTAATPIPGTAVLFATALLALGAGVTARCCVPRPL